MKKLGSLLIVLALSGLFVGCQKPASQPAAGSSAPAATSESAPATGESGQAAPEATQTSAPSSTGGEAQQ